MMINLTQKNMNNSPVLSILAYKVAPYIFDISSTLDHVSIRDQIVRAQILVNDLVTSGQLNKEKGDEILIIGGGVAGISAALAAIEKQVNATVLEVNQNLFELQSKVHTRFIGPYMYEWPADYYNDQRFPSKHTSLSAWAKSDDYSLPFKSIKPVPASKLAEDWRDWLHNKFKNNMRLKIFTGMTDSQKQCLQVYIKGFSGPSSNSQQQLSELMLEMNQWLQRDKDLQSEDLRARKSPKFIILAGGMGQETTTLFDDLPDIKGTAFWENDSLDDFSDKTVAIFGGGDGALQDFLRAITSFDHPLDFINKIHKCCFSKKNAIFLEKLFSIEQQHRLNHTWDIDGSSTQCKLIDQQCQSIAKKLAKNPRVRTAVHSNIKKGTGSVYLINRNDHFSKAYLLNRFLVHLVWECKLKQNIHSRNKINFWVHMSSTVTTGTKPSGKNVFHVNVFKNNSPISLGPIHKLIVRFGAQKNTVPFSRVGINSPNKAHRTTLSHIYQPLA